MTDGAVVWLTGLPAAGKSTLAAHLAERLRAAGRAAVILDGDHVRAALVPHPGHDEASRDAFYRTLGGLAALIAGQGVIALVPATAHRRVWRDAARSAAPRFVEVYVATPLAECERRDPKHLYADPAARAALPGTGVPYEEPLAPDVVAAGGGDRGAADAVLALLGVA